MRLIVVQYAGDYLEAYRQIQESGTETYFGHRYMLEQLGRISQDFGETALLCCRSPEKYQKKLPSGLTIMGANVDPRWNVDAVTRLIEEYNPTHMVAFGPLTGIIQWGVARNRRVMGIFADSFETNGIRRFLRYGRLAPLLNDQRIEWIANHGINACESLAKLGVARGKIVPMDWPHVRQPQDAPPKLGLNPGIPDLMYAGAVTEQKGVGDLIRAVALLKRHDLPIGLKIAGAGELDHFKALADKLTVSSAVRFLGLITNECVLQNMKDAAIVVVPSRHAYPEGFPLTIYEALCSRSPIIASDHPMFARHLTHRVSALIYPAAQPVKLAASIKELLDDQDLYRFLSASAQQTWQGLQLPVKWGDLLYRWTHNRPEDRSWIFSRRLDSGLYAI